MKAASAMVCIGHSLHNSPDVLPYWYTNKYYFCITAVLQVNLVLLLHLLLLLKENPMVALCAGHIVPLPFRLHHRCQLFKLGVPLLPTIHRCAVCD